MATSRIPSLSVLPLLALGLSLSACAASEETDAAASEDELREVQTTETRVYEGDADIDGTPVRVAVHVTAPTRVVVAQELSARGVGKDNYCYVTTGFQRGETLLVVSDAKGNELKRQAWTFSMEFGAHLEQGKDCDSGRVLRTEPVTELAGAAITSGIDASVGGEWVSIPEPYRNVTIPFTSKFRALTPYRVSKVSEQANDWGRITTTSKANVDRGELTLAFPEQLELGVAWKIDRQSELLFERSTTVTLKPRR